MNWDIRIDIDKYSSDYNKVKELHFRFTCGDREWKQAVDTAHLKDEKQRDAVLRGIARKATDELIVPKLVHTMLNALVSSALRGDNPLE